MFSKKSLLVAGAIALLIASNYGTYWATTMVSRVQVLEEQLKATSKENAGLYSALTDGPK